MNTYYWIATTLGSINDPANLSTTPGGVPNVTSPQGEVVFTYSTVVCHGVGDNLPLPKIVVVGNITVTLLTTNITLDKESIKSRTTFEGRGTVEVFAVNAADMPEGGGNVRLGQTIAFSEDGDTCTMQLLDANGKPTGEIVENVRVLCNHIFGDGGGGGGGGEIGTLALALLSQNEKLVGINTIASMLSSQTKSLVGV